MVRQRDQTQQRPGSGQGRIHLRRPQQDRPITGTLRRKKQTKKRQLLPVNLLTESNRLLIEFKPKSKRKPASKLKPNQRNGSSRHQDEREETQKIGKRTIGMLTHYFFVIADVQNDSNHHRRR